ncbi:MAG TPA: tetratricopeptide repeat protein [Candidatus Acidoferrales bacterium]|nr:tetratricopeptide repeat protein [Candidatus Acidoferrales bacterium]
MEAYKNGQYDLAIEDFKQASDLDPGLTDAKLYLATAYSNQYIPGAPSPENLRNGTEAIRVYQEILAKDPNNLHAIDGVGSMLSSMGGNPYDQKKMEEAKTYYQKHIQLKPTDAEPYYAVGTIDWAIPYHANLELREEYNKKAKKQLKVTDPLPPDLREQFSKEFESIVDEGIASLKKAIELKPDYDDAMAYLNLIYRQKADMETSIDARNADQKMADDLVDKVRAIKQKRAETPQSTS